MTTNHIERLDAALVRPGTPPQLKTLARIPIAPAPIHSAHSSAQVGST